MKIVLWILLGLLITFLCFVAWLFWYYRPTVEYDHTGRRSSKTEQSK
jgi:hypothetical protein